jgi:hypothetical protein
MKVFEYSEKHIATTTGEWIVLPNKDNDNLRTVTFEVLIRGGGTGRIEVTSAKAIDVQSEIDNPTGDIVTAFPWSLGDVTASANDFTQAPITAFRCISDSGTDTYFNVRAE